MDPSEGGIGKRISDLIGLARNDDAARLLGVDGALEGQLDLGFLDDPLDWIAYDIAQAIKATESVDSDVPAPTLAMLVAELRLYRLLRGEVDEIGLNRLVREYVAEEED